MNTEAPARTRSTLSWIRSSALSNLTFPLAALATSPILARSLHADGRGELAAITIPYLVASQTLTFGLPEALTLYAARRQLTRRQLDRLVVVIPALIALPCMVIAYLLIPGLLEDYPHQVNFSRGLFLLLPFTLMLLAARGLGLGSEQFKLVNRERYVSNLLRLVPLVVLFLVGALRPVSASLVSILAVVLSGVVLIPAWLRARQFNVSETVVVPTRSVMRYGGFIWIGSVAQYLTFRVDQVLLVTLVPAAALGAYALAVSLAEVSNSLTSAVREVLLSRSSGRDDSSMVTRGCRLAVALSLGFAVVAGICTQIGTVAVFGADFEPAIRLTQILLLASVGSGLGAVVGVGFAVAGRPGTWSVAQLVGLVVTLVTIVPVVHAYGTQGAAWLSVASYWVTTLLGILVLRRGTDIPLRDYLVPKRSDLALLRGRR